ncbi:MAG TPA: hypothetical protein DDX39_00670 [Bacteroidales bacterium]|nr:MAG: hypothetical protein A2W98_08220 [Bacteroidetes bacterium GWF2_33_38]OFY90615.1 MAG: hypothetical protein A2236_05685 [Bacteroidetes bacterium RIFOXYA2_FULL_33_7]HBF87124.1 hypothetical protein [Bacteroidales bacterium]
MKNLSLIILFFLCIYSAGFAIQPYYKLGSVSTDMITSISKIKSTLVEKGYEIVGEYNPGNKKNLYVIAFTSKNLKITASSFKDRGYLASIMRIGLVLKGGKVIVSLTNPDYIFNAYFGEALSNASLESTVNKVSAKIISDVKSMGTEFTAFGGEVEKEDLREYHYMLGMPYFSEPVELNTFNSFDEGVSTIKKNLAMKKGSTLKVYEIIDKEKKIAVFGVGLLDATIGEAHFLPIIGEDNVAAMPYEIILQDKEATMLHGRYRFALYWNQLTMGTFTKIMSTPGDVEDLLEALTK